LAAGSFECMGVLMGHEPGRARTLALLEQIVGGDAALKLRRQVLGRNRGATVEQVEEAFQEACARAARSCRGQAEGEVYTWLRTTTDRCLWRMRERGEREVIVDRPFDELEVGAGCAPGADVAVLEREHRVDVAQVASVVLERLSERQLDVAALHARGLRRQEIAERLQISPRTVKRLIEQILATGRTELAQLAGHGCEHGHTQVARYAFGLAEAREARRAQLHLATCERCGAMYERLDVWREQVAALLPLAPVAASHSQLVERVVHVGADFATSTPPDVVAGPGAVRRHASGALAYLRDHAAAAYSRVVDPTPLAGARPGAVAATVAGCLALSGGATYCVQQSTDPLTALSGIGAASAHKSKPTKPKPKRVRAVQTPAPPPVVAAPTPPPAVQPPPVAPPPPATATPAALPPAPEDEFEPTSAAAGGQTSSQTTAPKPAPAPADGPSEFGGP